MDKFQNKYRIPSARASWWNYCNNGLYFITICTAGREHFFGEIENGEMALSEIGKITQSCWFEIPQHFTYVKLDAFVVMPNHVHGIVVIDKESLNLVETLPVETLHATSLRRRPSISKQKNEKMASISPKYGSLGSIIRSYKSAITKNVRLIHADFAWQSRFHEHIIRNDEEYNRIKNYILENPMRWEKEKFFKNE